MMSNFGIAVFIALMFAAIPTTVGLAIWSYKTNHPHWMATIQCNNYSRVFFFKREEDARHALRRYGTDNADMRTLHPSAEKHIRRRLLRNGYKKRHCAGATTFWKEDQ